MIKRVLVKILRDKKVANKMYVGLDKFPRLQKFKQFISHFKPTISKHEF